jgi:hypothetical protein
MTSPGRCYGRCPYCRHDAKPIVRWIPPDQRDGQAAVSCTCTLCNAVARPSQWRPISPYGFRVTRR